MSPVDIPQLPYEDGNTDSAANLLPTFDPNYVGEQGEPFTPNGEVTPGYFDPEERRAVPYTEDDIIEPVRSEVPAFVPPQVVDDNTFANNLLTQWQAEAKVAADKEWANANEVPIRQAALFVGRDLGSPVAAAALNMVAEVEYKNTLAKKYEWTGQEGYPSWETYRDTNYAADWASLTAAQQREVYNKWTGDSAEYWMGLQDVPEEEFNNAMTVARSGGLYEQVKEFSNKEIAEDGTWLGANLPWTTSLAFDEGVVDAEAIAAGTIKPSEEGIFSKSFDAKQADLLAGRVNSRMRELLESKNLVAEWGALENGKITKEGIAEAKRSLTDDFNELEGSTDPEDIKEQRATRVNYEASMRKLDRLEEISDPEGEITKHNEAYQRLRRMSQNFKIIQSPEVRSMLEARTAGDLWEKVKANPTAAGAYYWGEGLAQQADTAPALAGAVVASGLTGGLATPLIAGATGAGSARQEIEAIIPELIEQRMRYDGLDPKNSESWGIVMSDKSFYNDIVAEAQRKGITTGVVEGGLTALFSQMVKLVPRGSGFAGRSASFTAKRAAELGASVVGAGAGEVTGQVAQDSNYPVDRLALLQEVLAEGPSQTQQTVLENTSKIVGGILGAKQTPTDAGTTTATPSGEVTLDSIEASLGTKVPQASPQVTKENGAAPAATDGNVTPPSGQNLAATIDSVTGVVNPEPVRSAEESAAFFASLPEPKSAFSSAQVIVDSPNATILTPEEMKHQELLEQLTPDQVEMISRVRAAKITERNKAQEAIKMDENFRKNIVNATRSIGQETSPIEMTKGKGMSVEESNRRNQGGFVDLNAAFDGVHDFAVDAWSKASDFGTWATEMVTKYTNKILPHLENLWNSISSAVTWAKDYFTYTENASARQRGGIDARRTNRIPAGGPFNYGVSPYDAEKNTIGGTPITKSGVLSEVEFLAINKSPLPLKKSELEFYKTIVPEAFSDGKVDVKKLYKGLEDNGPVVNVTAYGKDLKKKKNTSSVPDFKDYFEEKDPKTFASLNRVEGDYNNAQHYLWDGFTPLQKKEAKAFIENFFDNVLGFYVSKKSPTEKGFQEALVEYKTALDNTSKLDDLRRGHLAAWPQTYNDYFSAKNTEQRIQDEWITEYEIDMDKESGSTLTPTNYYNTTVRALDPNQAPPIRVDLTIPTEKPFINEDGDEETRKVFWPQDDLHENMPNTFGWAMIQPVTHPISGKPAWFVAEIQSQWEQKRKKFQEAFEIKEFTDRIPEGEFVVINKNTDSKTRGVYNPDGKWKTKEQAKAFIKSATDRVYADHPFLPVHQQMVLRAVIGEAKKAGIDEVIVSDAETAMMTEQHDRFPSVPEGTHVIPGIGTYIVHEGGDSATFYREDEIKNGEKQTAGKQIKSYNKEWADLKANVTLIIKQAGGMRLAYDTTLPSAMKAVTGRIGVPVDLGEHKNNQSIYTPEGDYRGEGSNVFTGPDGKPKRNVTGLSYDLTNLGPKAELIFAADPFGVNLVMDSVRIAFRGAREFSEFAARIVKELGEWIKPYAQKLWDTMKDAPETLQAVVTEIAHKSAPKTTGKFLAKSFRAAYSSLPKSNPLRVASEKIEWAYLPYTDRQNITNLTNDYFAAKKGKGPIVKNTVMLNALADAARKSYTNAFDKAKQVFPLSLKDKSATDFTSLADVRGYVASQNNTESAKVAARYKARAKAAQTRKTNRAAAANAGIESAKAEIEAPTTKAMIDAISDPDQKRDAIEALDIVAKIDHTLLSDSEKEHITAAIQNIADGKLIGVGAILAKYRGSRFIVTGHAAKKAVGSGLSVPLTGVSGKVVDPLSAGKVGQAFSRNDTRERITFLSPVFRQLWRRHFAPFTFDGLNKADAMKLDHTRKLEKIITQYGFAKTFGKIFTHNVKTLKAKEMGIVSLLSQFRDVDPIGDLTRQLNNVLAGVNAQISDKSTMYQAIGQVEGKMISTLLEKAAKEGYLARDEKGQMTINTDPETWTSFLFNTLDKNQQEALKEIWALTSQYTDQLKFVQEFTYGKEWEPWNNYVMQQAIPLNGQEDNIKEGMDLDSSTLANSDFAVPVGKTQSILNPRIGLAKGQFYNLNIFHTAIHGMNQAAYEIGTAQPRMDIKAIFEDPLSTGLWDSEADKKLSYAVYKDVHQKSLGIETGTMPEGTPAAQITAYALIRPLQAWTAAIMGSVTQPIKQFASPMAAYGMSDMTSGAHLIGTINHIFHSKEWTNEARRKFYGIAIPSLLTRIATYDPAYDDMTGSGVIEDIRRISKDRDFVPMSTQQKRMKAMGRILNAGEAAATPAIGISRFMNVMPDQLAAELIFMSEYSKNLIKTGAIKSIEEFTPETPYEPNAAQLADTTVTEILGGASSREKRPNVFSYTKELGAGGRLVPLLLRSTLLHLSSIRTQMASDTFRSIGEAFYENPKDKVGSQAVRDEARLRIRRNVVQNAIFLAVGAATGHFIKNTIIFGAASIPGLAGFEGLDEEEKELLKRIERIRVDAQKPWDGTPQFVNMLDRAIQDVGVMMFGGLATNAVAGYAVDQSTAQLFETFFKEDFEARYKAIQDRQNKETDPRKKEALQQEIDIIKKINQNFAYKSQYGMDLGQVEGLKDFKDYILRPRTISNVEADRIAMEYYEATKGKPGAMKSAPYKTGVQRATRLATDRVLRLISTDVGISQDRINKVRTVMAERRKTKLDSAIKNKDPVDVVDIKFGSPQ